MKNKINSIIILIIIIILFVVIFINKINYKDLQKDILFFKYLGKQEKSDEEKNIVNQQKIENIINREEQKYDKNNGNDLNKSKKEEDINVEKQYIFKMQSRNTNFQNVNLKDTIQSKTLINEKIAPGIKGVFDIVIYSNYDANYKINFESKSLKPKNLQFSKIGTEIKSNTLEGLVKNLCGYIPKGEKEVITIGWEWNYENGSLGNKQDTEDAIAIKEYSFTISAYGEEVI